MLLVGVDFVCLEIFEFVTACVKAFDVAGLLRLRELRFELGKKDEFFVLAGFDGTCEKRGFVCSLYLNWLAV